MTALSAREKALAGPRDLKEPGSPEWCWQTLTYLASCMKRVDQDYMDAAKVLGELENVKAWKRIPPDSPYGSLDAMLKAEVGVSAREARKQINDASKRARALDGKTVNRQPGPSRNVMQNRHDMTVSNDAGQRGESADYLTRRIARDHPDIFEAMKAGEFPSARAAALKAGILHPTATIRTDDPEAAARVIRKHFDKEQRATLARLLLDG